MAITYIDYSDNPEKTEPSVGDKVGLGMKMLGIASEKTPASYIRSKTFEPAGEGIAEVLGERGAPVTGAALGTAVQMAPDILGMALGTKGTYSSTNPTVKGLINTTKELGKDFGIQNEAIGVTRRVPVESGMKARVPIHGNPPASVVEEAIPSQYPKNTGAFLNYANSKIQGVGDRIHPQELMDWQVKLQTDLNNGSIPKFDQETGRITTAYQQATQLLDKTKKLFNNVAGPLIDEATLPEGTIPTRGGLNQAFKIAAQRESLGKTAKKVVKGAVGAGAGFIGGKAIIDYIKTP